MADDSDGEYVGTYSDDDINDHQVTSGTEHNGGLDSSRLGTRSHQKSLGGSKPARDRRKKQRQLAAWEEGKFNWLQGVPEDEEGNIALTQTVEADKRRRLLRDTTPLQRGIIRHLVLVLDMSFAMMEKDLLPNRFRLTMSYAVEFVREYFEQNPISQMGIIIMRLGVAKRVSEMTGNPAVLIDRLRAIEKDKEPEGDPSLQNALEMCRGELLYVVTFSHLDQHMRLMTDTAIQPHTLARYPRSPHNIRRSPFQRSRRHTRHHTKPHLRSHTRLNGGPGCSGGYLCRVML